MRATAHIENVATVAGFVWLATVGHWAMALVLLLVINFPRKAPPAPPAP